MHPSYCTCCYRVWIKLLNFKDYVKGAQEKILTGDAELMKDQLCKEHECTVFVSIHKQHFHQQMAQT